MSKPSIEELKAFLGKCGSANFQLEQTSEGFTASTRDHGDIVNETPGKQDIQNARALAKALKAQFPEVSLGLEIIDEWTELEIKWPKETINA